METFKSVIISIIVLGIVVVVGYWAFITLEPGGVHVIKKNQRQVEQRLGEIEKELEQLRGEMKNLELWREEQVQLTKEKLFKEATQESEAKPLTHQDLINALRELINDKVLIRDGSRGSRVGTVQEFLNLYNKASRRIDNDYGSTTKNLVIQFQKDQGLTADGEAGSSTFQKMIEWLEKN